MYGSDEEVVVVVIVTFTVSSCETIRISASLVPNIPSSLCDRRERDRKKKIKKARFEVRENKRENGGVGLVLFFHVS